VSRSGDQLRRTFSSLGSSRNFRLYLFGQLVSATGTWVNFTATAWLVLRLTNSGVALGVNTALLFLPVLLLGAWGGVLADRFDKRRILIWTQTGFSAVAFILFALVVTDVVQLWMVYALSLMAGVVMAVDMPTRQSFYIEMVGKEKVTNAVSLNSAAFTGSRILGPAVAGALIATVGIAWPFLVDGISYAAVIVALLMMRKSELHRQERTTRDRGHLVAGIKYVWRTDELRRPLVGMAVVCTLAFNFQVLLPLLTVRTFHGTAGTFAAFSALAGFGSFLGAIVMANRDARPTMQRLAIFSVFAGVVLVVVGVSPFLWLVMAAMVPLGYSLMAFLITANTMLQLNAAPQARGRVMALYGVVFLGSTPIGAPIAGWVGEHMSAGAGLVMGGVAAVGTGVVLMWQRRRRSSAAAAAEPAVVDEVSTLSA
jgi:MFS family permease